MKRGWLLVLASLVIVAASCDKNSNHAGAGKPGTGDGAPGFVLKDIENRQVSLNDYRGKIVVLEFWATWCPPCNESIPELIAVQKKFSGSGVQVLGISVDEEEGAAAKLRRFVQEQGINYPILLGNEKVKKDYGVFSIPATFLIDGEGNVRKSILGYTENLSDEIIKEIGRLK